MYFLPVHISDTSLIGVFAMEAIVSIGLAWSCYYYCKEKYDPVTAVGFTGLTVALFRIVYAELMLNTEPICIIVLFLLLEYTERCEYRRYRRFDYFIFGLIFGLLFWMKYPMVIILFPFWCYFLYYSVKVRKVGLFVKRCLLSAYGFLLISIPVLGYFIYNKNLKQMYEVYFKSVQITPSGFMGNTDEITAILIGVITILGFYQIHKSNYKDIFFGAGIFSIFLTANISGGVRTYTSCFLIVLIPMFLPVVLQHRYLRAVGIGCLAMIAGICCMADLSDKNVSGLSTDEIASKYQTTNENVLYLYEDMGLGTTSPEPYQYVFQWKPGRITYEENDDCYFQTMDLITNKTIPYICINASDYDTVPDANADRYARIVHAVKENYEIKDTMIYDEGTPISYYFCEQKNENETEESGVSEESENE